MQLVRVHTSIARRTCWLTTAPAWNNFLTTWFKFLWTASSSGVASPLSWIFMSIAGWDSSKSKYDHRNSSNPLLFHWPMRMCKGVRPSPSRWLTLAPNLKRSSRLSGRLFFIARWMDESFLLVLKSFTSAPASNKSSTKASSPFCTASWRHVISCGNPWTLLIYMIVNLKKKIRWLSDTDKKKAILYSNSIGHFAWFESWSSVG